MPSSAGRSASALLGAVSPEGPLCFWGMYPRVHVRPGGAGRALMHDDHAHRLLFPPHGTKGSGTYATICRIPSFAGKARHVLTRLGVHRRLEAVTLALRNGLI